MRGFAWRLRQGNAIIATRRTAAELAPITKYLMDYAWWERLSANNEWVFYMTLGEWREKIWMIRCLYHPYLNNGHLDLRRHPAVYTLFDLYKELNKTRHERRRQREYREMVESTSPGSVERG